MLTPPLIVFGSTAPQQSSAGAQPFVLRTLRKILADAGAQLWRAALTIVMPFQGNTEPPPPRYMARTIALLQRAQELEKTDPEAASELRWLATSYCYF